MKPQLEKMAENRKKLFRMGSRSRMTSSLTRILMPWITSAASSATQKLWKVSVSSGRWNTTMRIQGDTTYISRLDMDTAPLWVMRCSFPSTKPVPIMRNRISTCVPTERNDSIIPDSFPPTGGCVHTQPGQTACAVCPGGSRCDFFYLYFSPCCSCAPAPHRSHSGHPPPPEPRQRAWPPSPDT